VKWVAIGVGVLVALFVGSALVVGTLEGLGVIDAPEGDSEKSSESAKSDRGGGSDGQLQKDRSGRPLLRVTDVIDGDTVETDKQGRVRLIGVDTPEKGRCQSDAATAFTRQRLLGQEVGYELGAERKDRYGRTLAYLYRDEKMHDLDLLRGGYAKVLTIPPNDKYAGRFRQAAQSARGANAGVWGVCEQRVRDARVRRERAARARREARRARVRRGLARERARAARQRRADRERNRPSPAPAPDPPSDGGGSGSPSCLPSSACPGKRDGDGDGCYCE
jgi:micrococcal nuclease